MSARLPERKASLPSVYFPFVNVMTNGKRKDTHNSEVQFLQKLLLDAGVSRIRIDHVKELNLDKDLPLTWNGKRFDIAYQNHEGNTVLIEVKIVKTKEG